MVQRIYPVQESDLRMLGDLARNIQRVLPVTQADIDAAAALGQGWVVERVVEVSAPLDNMRGGTQLVIKQNSITPGQNVRRVLIVSGPGGEKVIVGPGIAPLSLPDAIANSLDYVTAFGGTEQRDIPDNYLQRQFIYMMDGSYLLTDIVPTYDCKIEMDFQTTSIFASGGAFLGGRTGAYPNGLLLAWESNGKFSVDGFSDSRYVSTESVATNTRYKYVWNNQVATVYQGNTTVFTNTFTGTTATGAELVINGRNADGTVYGNVVGIYLYSFKIWNAQGELVADYVPAVQKGTVPVVGFYDTVSKTFKTATAGTFAAGGEAVPTPDYPMDIVCNNGVLKARHQSGLPLGYTLLDYIESTGTQYIDTGIVDITDSEFVLDARLTATSASGFPTMLGALNSAYEHKYKVVFGETSGTLFYTQPGVGSSNYTYASAADTNRHIFKLTTGATSGGTLLIDNNSLNFNYEIQSDTTLSLYLSARNNNGNATNFITMACYGLQIKKSGVLVRNFVPAKDSNNVIGMYDLVSGQFFTNQGTGDFVAGPNAVDPITIVTDGDVETINVHGKNLFDRATVTNGYYISVTGQIVENAASMYSDYIKVKPSTTYTISLISGSNGNAVRVHSYTSDKNWIEQLSEVTTGVEGSSYSATFTTSSNAEYIRFGCRQAQIDIQIEQGSTATDYEPYYDGGTATTEMLLKVGDYQDVQSIIDGVVTRNVGVLVLDGTENWSQYSASNKIYTFADAGAISHPQNAECLCSHFVTTSSIPVSTENTNKLFLHPTVARIYICFPDIVGDVPAFKSWLATQYAAGTPIMIIYPLATETTESVTGQTLQVTDGDNVIDITQASLSGLELEAEYTKEV